MNLKELIDYYDKIKDKIHIESKHYDIVLLMRKKGSSNKNILSGEPDIYGKHYWINVYNFKDNDLWDFFYAKDIDAYCVKLDEKIQFSAHISVICILGRENFIIDKNGDAYFLQGKKKIKNVTKIAKLCVDKLKYDYDCVVEPHMDGKLEEFILFLEELAIPYNCVRINA